MPITESTRITLRYDGEAFNKHSMDAIQVADAIKGLAVSLIQADKLLNGEKSELKVEVIAFQDGCFGTVLDILQIDVNAINVLATMGFITGSAAVTGLTQGVMGYLKQLRGKKIYSTENTVDNQVLLTLKDGETLTMPSEVAKLITDKTVRGGLDAVVHQPLVNDGADSVSIGLTVENENASAVVPQITVTAEENTDFKKPTRTIELIKETDEVTKDIRFAKINFKGKTGWSAVFPDGEEKAVKMNDDSFLDRASQNQEQFSSEMLFSVKLEVTKTSSQEKTTQAYTVIKVLRHRAASENKIMPNL